MAGRVELVKVPEWAGFAWLRHGFSTRRGGKSTVYGGNDLNLGFTVADEREIVEQNRRAAVEALAPEAGLTTASLATVRQIHGVKIVRGVGGGASVEADGMMTDAAGVILGIQVADCVPVLLADTRQRVVAALHAGWRGTVEGIAGAGVARLAEEFGSRAEDLVAAVGPSIGPCCYVVGEELIERVGWETGLLERRNGMVYFNLWEANRRQLETCGVGQIALLELCTACARVDGERRFFSHRAEAGKTGRAMGLIGVR